jgi:hypothetical protein
MGLDPLPLFNGFRAGIPEGLTGYEASKRAGKQE